MVNLPEKHSLVFLKGKDKTIQPHDVGVHYAKNSADSTTKKKKSANKSRKVLGKLSIDEPVMLWWTIHKNGNRQQVFMHNQSPKDPSVKPLGQKKWEADFRYERLAVEYIQSRIETVTATFSGCEVD